MKVFLRFFKAWWPALVWVSLGAALFWPVANFYDALPAPDDSPMYLPRHFALSFANARAAGAGWAPLNFLPALMPPLAAHDFAYFLTPLLMMLAAAWWFTARGAERLPALVAGGVLGFAGYSFTLVAAGHRGFFDMTVYLMLLFGAMARALGLNNKNLHTRNMGAGRSRYFYFALSGAAAGWTLTAQPDFGAVALGVAALYAVWILATGAWRGIQPLKFAAGAALALACFALAAAGTMQNIFTTLLPGRMAQISGSSPAAAPGEEMDAEGKWIFATNWSLPPGETLELIAPNYKGTSTWDAQTPYWGHLGRAWKWEETKQGFKNFRGHTVYIGLLPLLVAGFAVVAWILRRRWIKKKSWEVPPPDSWKPCPLHDVPFWAVLGLVALVLAFGRYTPVYKLFYSLPQMSLLRAPVKFIRVLEWSSAFCLAAGLTVLLRRPFSKPVLKQVCIALGVCAAGFIVFANVLPASWPAQIAEAGHAGLKTNLLAHAGRALWHPAWAATVLAGFLILLRFQKTNWTLALLAVFLALDMRRANAPYITSQDMRVFYTPSPAQAVFDAERKNDPLLAQADFVLTPRGGQHIIWPLRRAGVGNTTPTPQADPSSPLVRFWQTQFNRGMTPPALLRYVRLTGARLFWLEAAAAGQIARALPGAVSIEGLYEFTGAGLRPVDSPRDGALALLSLKDALPAAWISTQWTSVEMLDEQLAAAAAANYNPLVSPVSDAPMIEAPGSRDASATLLNVDLAIDPIRGKVSYRATEPALLTVRFGRTAGLVAKLEDGTRLPVYASSLFWTGVVVPAGEHTVTLRRDDAKAPFFYASLAPMLLLAAWGVFLVWQKRGIPR